MNSFANSAVIERPLPNPGALWWKAQFAQEQAQVAGVEKVVYQYTRGHSAAEFREKLQGLAGRVDAVVSGLGN